MPPPKDDMMRSLIKAIPRLREGDAKADKLQRGLVRRGSALWAAGPRRLKKLGILIPDDDYKEVDGDFLREVHGILGDKRFQTFMKLVKDDLTRKLAEKKAAKRAAGGDSDKVRRKKKRKRRSSSDDHETPEPIDPNEFALDEPQPALDALSPAPLDLDEHDDDDDGALNIKIDLEDSNEDDDSAKLTISDPGDGSDEGLAIPDLDDDDGLAIPDLDLDAGDDAPDLGGAPDIDLDNLEIMGNDKPVRFDDDDAGGGAAKADDDDDPAKGAERALRRWRGTGEPDELKLAKKLFKAAVKAAKTPVTKGAALGGMAEVCFLEGDLDKATDLAKKALKSFPHSPTAMGVLCRAKWPKAVEREQLKALLAQADDLLSQGNHDEVKKVAKRLSKAHPKEPFAALVLLAIPCDQFKDEIEEELTAAWKRYPASAEFADIPLGPAIESAVIQGPLRWLATRVEKEGGDVLGQTVKDVESKSNVVAGAWQIPLGVARAALCGRKKLSKHQHQQLVKWIGDGLFSAQYYDAAKDAYAFGRTIDREGDLVPEFHKGETQCGVMRRAFDRPGVKNKTGKCDGIGFVRYRKAVAAQLKVVLGDAEGDRAKLDAAEEKLVEAILASPKRQKALTKRAKADGQDDPFERFSELLAQEGELSAKQEAPPKKGGLFGRMKAGMTKAIDKAKGSVVASKKKEAMKALGRRLRDAPAKGWGDEALDAFLAKVEKLEPRLDFLEEQASRLRRAADAAGKTV